MAVGHAVGRNHPDPYFGTGVGDDRERALDVIGSLVVIDDRRGPLLEGLDRAQFGRPLQHGQIHRRVEPPPDLFENPLERRRGQGWRGHAPRQSRVEVVVGAHQARRHRRHDLHFVKRRVATQRRPPVTGM